MSASLLLATCLTLAAPDDTKAAVDKRVNESLNLIMLGVQVKTSVSDKTIQMLGKAMTLLGVPYKRGGSSSESGFDCSGFVRFLYETSVGRLLPRRTGEQAKFTEQIDRIDLNPGDLVFFNTMRAPSAMWVFTLAMANSSMRPAQASLYVSTTFVRPIGPNASQGLVAFKRL